MILFTISKEYKLSIASDKPQTNLSYLFGFWICIWFWVFYFIFFYFVSSPGALILVFLHFGDFFGFVWCSWGFWIFFFIIGIIFKDLFAFVCLLWIVMIFNFVIILVVVFGKNKVEPLAYQYLKTCIIAHKFE